MSAAEDKELLIRLDERFRILTEKLDEVVEAIEKTRDEFRKDYVTQREFDPVRRAVYAAVGIIITGIIGGLVMMVLGIK